MRRQQPRIKRSESLQQEINKGKRLIVGVNAFQGEEGPINRAIEDTSYRVPSKKLRLETIAAIKRLRKPRDQQVVIGALREVYRATKEARNVVRPVIEAAKTGVTTGEVVGVIRMAYGYRYDPLGEINMPSFISEVTRGEKGG